MGYARFREFRRTQVPTCSFGAGELVRRCRSVVCEGLTFLMDYKILVTVLRTAIKIENRMESNYTRHSVPYPSQ
jgi:hypothetical protein